MKRIDYRVGWSERHAGITLPRAIAPALRAPACVLACACLLVAVMWGAQHARAVAAQREGAQQTLRLIAVEADLARDRELERELVTLRALAARLTELRRSGARRASEIAVLGDRLPRDAWLTSLRADRNAVTIEGRGARVASVGAAIAGLAQLPAYGGVRLISVRQDAARSGVTYALALEPRR